MADELDGSDPQGQPDYEDLMRRLMGSTSGTPEGGSAPAQPDVPPPTVPTDASRMVRSNPIGPRQAAPENVSAPTMASAWGAPPAAAIKTMPAPSELPSPMGTSTPSRISDLVAQRAKVGQPLDPNAVDPNTGKPKYRMGIGSRILGTLANAAMGFGRTGGEPVYVGPGAKNQRYYNEEATREAQSSNLDTEIANQEKIQGMNQKAYEDAIKSTYETELGGARKETAEAQMGRAAAAGETADVRQQLASSQEELNRARAGKAENTVPTNEFSGWYSAFRQQNGRTPNAQEIQQYELQKARAGKDTSAADLAKAIQIAEYKGRQTDSIEKQREAERSKRYAELDKNIMIKANPDRLAAEKAKVDEELETRYGKRIQSMSDEADKMLGLTKAGTKLQSAPKAPPKPVNPPAAGKTWVWEKATGKRGQIPQSQLKQATEGQNSRYATW